MFNKNRHIINKVDRYNDAYTNFILKNKFYNKRKSKLLQRSIHIDIPKPTQMDKTIKYKNSRRVVQIKSACKAKKPHKKGKLYIR